MPRWRSISMKSEVAPFLILLLLTAPATWMAPPKRSSFSVRVVLPASGCAMTAKVRRRVISSCKVMRSLSCRCCGGAVVSRRTVVAAFRVSRFSPGRLPVRFSGSLSGHFPAVLGANLPAVSGYLFRFLRFLRFLWSFSVLPGPSRSSRFSFLQSDFPAGCSPLPLLTDGPGGEAPGPQRIAREAAPGQCAHRPRGAAGRALHAAAAAPAERTAPGPQAFG